MTEPCKRCGYSEGKQLYEGYCFQCACDVGIETNPHDLQMPISPEGVTSHE